MLVGDDTRVPRAPSERAHPPLSDVPAASDFARDPDVRRLLGSEDPATWIVRGQGLVGLGRTAAYRVRGGTRFTSARVWWDAVREAARVTDEVRLPGTGLLAFGAFAFAPSSTVDSGLMVPELVVGTTGDTAWLTLVTTEPSPRSRTSTPPGAASHAWPPPGALPPPGTTPPRRPARTPAVRRRRTPRRCPVRWTRNAGWRRWRTAWA